MAHGLLISDHEILNDLYHLNLKAFVDLGLTTKTSLEDALKIIELDAYGDIIITLSQINGEDAALAITELLEKKGVDVPVVVIGERSQISNTAKVSTLPANLNIPVLIKKCAEILGVTAKDMAGKAVPEYYPIPISLMEAFESSPCSIFIKTSTSPTSNEFVQILEAKAPLKEKAELYKEKGAINFYIPSSMRLEFTNKVSEIVNPVTFCIGISSIIIVLTVKGLVLP